MARKGTLNKGETIDPKRCPHVISKGKREGCQCKHVAGQGTNHQGTAGSYCTDHGGNNGPVTTYRWAKYTPDWLKDRAEYYMKDPDLLSIKPIIGHQQAILSVIQERVESEESIDTAVVEQFQKASEAIARNIERQHNIEIKREYLVGIERVNAIVEEFVMIISDIAKTDKERLVAVKRLEVVAALKGGNGNSYLSP